jgi:hypothetical protein
VSGTVRGKSSPEHQDRRRGPQERRRQVAGKAIHVVVLDEFQNPSRRGQVQTLGRCRSNRTYGKGSGWGEMGTLSWLIRIQG